jgi:hypothetical protein
VQEQEEEVEEEQEQSEHSSTDTDGFNLVKPDQAPHPGRRGAAVHLLVGDAPPPSPSTPPSSSSAGLGSMNCKDCLIQCIRQQDTFCEMSNRKVRLLDVLGSATLLYGRQVFLIGRATPPQPMAAPMRIGINGFGRIGRLVFRALSGHAAVIVHPDDPRRRRRRRPPAQLRLGPWPLAAPGRGRPRGLHGRRHRHGLVAARRPHHRAWRMVYADLLGSVRVVAINEVSESEIGDEVEYVQVPHKAILILIYSRND